MICLDLLDEAAAASLRYGIPGYPHKLGLLLYGPPGTGKTSMIKVLARSPARFSSSLAASYSKKGLGLGVVDYA